MERVARVSFHDSEMAGVTEDLPLWRLTSRSPVLEIGAGTGRVSVALAQAGYDVTAVEPDPVLAEELAARAAGSVKVVETTAEELPVVGEFGTVLVADGTLHLFEPKIRRRVLHNAARNVRSGGFLAAFIYPTYPQFEGHSSIVESYEHHGRTYGTYFTACVDEGEWYRIDAVDSIVRAGATESETPRSWRLYKMSADDLEVEALEHGFRPALRIPLSPAQRVPGVAIFLERE